MNISGGMFSFNSVSQGSITGLSGSRAHPNWNKRMMCSPSRAASFSEPRAALSSQPSVLSFRLLWLWPWIYVERRGIVVPALILIDLFRDVKMTGSSLRVCCFIQVLLEERSAQHAQ